MTDAEATVDSVPACESEQHWSTREKHKQN